MRIWNTLSGKKDELEKPTGRPLRLFVCGPTVYDYSHIGHARTFFIYDTLVRYLRSKKWDVFYLQNITDVDDKIISRAKAEGKKPLALARFFIHAYLEDMKALGIKSVSMYAPASRFIPQIVKQVRTLVNKGFAYEIPEDGIYFDISKFPDYGKLSGRTVLQAEDAVSRIDEGVNKRNKGDFALWKFPKTPVVKSAFNPFRRFVCTLDGEPAWKTPIGWGRPGWHIEDTAISETFFGPQYDVHGGAAELKFPHHEAEIAQQEAASGKSPLVKIWMHSGILVINGQKMSKSLGNFITIRDFLKDNPPEILRWLFLSYHYRTPVDYTPELLNQIKVVFNRVRIFLEKLAFVSAKKDGKTLGIENEIKKTKEEFEVAMEDDFNTPLALSSLLGMINRLQNKIWGMNGSEATLLENYIKETLGMLGIGVKAREIPAEIAKLAAERELCRANEQFVQSDALRKKISVLGYSIEDTPQGPFVSKI